MRKNSIATAARHERAAWRRLAATALAGGVGKRAAAKRHAAARERLADELGLRGAQRLKAAKIYNAIAP